MTLLARIFGGRTAQQAYAPLYDAVVAEARRPHWYAQGGVPDTRDGRFEMVTGVLALVLIRLEAAGQPGREPAARLTELFVSDMDGHLRQEGVGDMSVGKRIGQMVSQLGGRVAAYREGLAEEGEALGAALDRNLWRGAPPLPLARAHSIAGYRALAARLAALPLDVVLAGSLG